jgi:hypothetical protein
VLNAIGLTFVVNLFLASLLVDYRSFVGYSVFGLLIGIYRAVLWGLIFFPGHPDMQVVMIPHSLTLILEGQAYILVMLAAWLQGRAFLFPQSAGCRRSPARLSRGPEAHRQNLLVGYPDPVCCGGLRSD